MTGVDTTAGRDVRWGTWNEVRIVERDVAVGFEAVSIGIARSFKGVRVFISARSGVAI